jgi:hypothetical protein
MAKDKRQISIHRADDTDLATRLEQAYETVASEEERRDLRLLLRGFEIAPFNALMGGSFKAFSKMTLPEREALLESWARSRFEIRRKAFQGLKRLALFIGYTVPGQSQLDYWQDIHYPGAPGASEDIQKAIKPYRITDNRTLETEVLIIGSGAGGGVVAGELSAAGYDVMVVEKGGYHSEEDFTGSEHDMTETLFENSGSLTTSNTAMVVLAGTTLGGGTTINWSASFRTPDHVLREWANEYGLTDAATDVWQKSLDAVHERSHVNCDESQLNGNNARLAQGIQKLGWQLEVIPRNVKGCEDCSFCNYGCAFGAKQGTLKNYLQDAHDRGGRFVVNATVRRVLHH